MKVVWQRQASAGGIAAYKIFKAKGRDVGHESHPICHISRCSEELVEQICDLLEKDYVEED